MTNDKLFNELEKIDNGGTKELSELSPSPTKFNEPVKEITLK